MHTLPKQSGFSLIEVLVALLVLSIGMIGLASLQLTDIKNNRDAYYRTQALILSNNIIEAMRANLKGMRDGNYDKAAGTAHAGCRSATPTPPSCTAAQLAGDDVDLWRAAVARVLPDGDAIVCLDDSPGDGVRTAASGTTDSCDGGSAYVSKIWWKNDGDANADYARLSVSFVP